MANKWLMSSMAMMMSFSAVATPIDGWDQQAYDQNQALLKAVIKLETGAFYAGKLCSSTLIAKNILLTAQHCADNLAPGKRIKLNGNPQYEVVNVLKQEGIDKVVGETPDGKSQIKTSTDVALILFKSSDCSSATLGGIQPIPLAKSASKSGLSNRVLIAGYGITNPSSEDAGTLRAGYNEWVVSDYSKTADPKLTAVIRAVATAIELPQNVLIMKGDRSQMDVIANVKGQKISTEVSRLKGSDTENAALPLPGDSGGSAIAFDSKQNPYIVGVTSMAAPKVAAPTTMILAAEPNSNKVFFEANLSEKSMEQVMDDLMAKLIELKYVAPNETVLKDFGVLRMAGRRALGTYASVLNPENDSFITQSLAALIKQRDAANYCQ